MKLRKRFLLLVLVVIFCNMSFLFDLAWAAYPAPYTCTRNFYVATTGSDVSGCGTSSSPCRTLQYADNNLGLVAGDCVNVAAGTYLQSSPLQLNIGGSANQPNGYVTWIGAPNYGSTIKSDNSASPPYNLIQIQASYIILDGFNVDGNDGQVQDYAVAAGSNQSTTNVIHHLMVLNSYIHSSGGGGIGFRTGDYYIIAGNTVYGTSGTSGYQESGISIYEPIEIPGFTPSLPWDIQKYHIQILQNVSSNNIETYSCGSNPGCHTDGEGIIADDWQVTQWSGGPGPYPYYGLIQSNTVYGNGGGGIRVNLSLNVDVYGNTAYGDDLDIDDNGTWRGELSNEKSENVNWFNNAAYSIPATGSCSFPSNPTACNTAILWGGTPDSNVLWQNNQTYNITNSTNGSYCATSVQINSTSSDSANCSAITQSSSNNSIGTLRDWVKMTEDNFGLTK